MHIHVQVREWISTASLLFLPPAEFQSHLQAVAWQLLLLGPLLPVSEHEAVREQRGRAGASSLQSEGALVEAGAGSDLTRALHGAEKS